MGVLDFLKAKNKKTNNIPFIAKHNLSEIQKQREENFTLGETSILASQDFTQKILSIRLIYTSFSKYQGYDGVKLGQTYGISSPFIPPQNMSIEDACKVVSYLSDKVETSKELEQGWNECVAGVSHVLESYGFRKKPSTTHGIYHNNSYYHPLHKIQIIPQCREIEGTTDLFSVGGDVRLFNKSELNNRYFDWYTKDVSENDIREIYQNIGQEYILDNALSSENENTL